RAPLCSACPLRSMCAAHRAGMTEAFPAPRKRAPVVRARAWALVLERGARYLLRRRPAGVPNPGFWEFPTFEGAPRARPRAAVEAALRSLGLGPAPAGVSIARGPTVRHAILARVLEIEVFEAHLDAADGRNRRTASGASERAWVRA